VSQQLDRKALANILQAEDIESLAFPEIVRLFREEEGVGSFLPDGVCQFDPRNGDRIIYNSSRARRPHDNRPLPSSNLEQECEICQGNTTGVIDVADLSQGFTFINKNLFPILYPLSVGRSNHSAGGGEQDLEPGGRPSYGFHFLQWTSSQHDSDWHNMPLGDRVIVMKRLAALEKKLLTESKGFMPATEVWGDQAGRHGFVSIIKNHGRLVGGSLSHSHQQIAFSNIMPRRVRDNWRFEAEKGEPFSACLLRENPPELVIRDYGSVTLVVPYFMRRPFDMFLLVEDVSKRYLHELAEVEITAVAEGWYDAIRAILMIMPEIGREIAYNVTTNIGLGAGIYFEFLPYTQETGGFENLGLFVCQKNPKSAATHIRYLLEY
jgi:galactose-1-phosphate uridylyltransferase